MNSVISKWVIASVFSAALLFLSGCGGGSSTSSSGGGNATGFASSTMVVKGNVSIEGGQAVFYREMPQSGVGYYVQLLSDAAVPLANAAEVPLEGIEVCVELECMFTDSFGNFSLDLTGLPGGHYVISFTLDKGTSDETSYTGSIDVKNYTIVTLTGVLLEDEDTGTVRIEVVSVVIIKPTEGAVGDEEDVEKFIICHKPGTPAQQNLVLPQTAIDNGHLGHDDTEGPCGEIEVEEVEEVEDPE